jgi:hypothetical protein
VTIISSPDTSTAILGPLNQDNLIAMPQQQLTTLALRTPREEGGA